MRYMIGVDVGGTFTDLTFVDSEQHKLSVHKLPSTPDDPSEAIVTGIKEILKAEGVSPAEVDYLAHGTTVATNALIERKGARTGLLTTEGFKDLLEIGDQTRPSLYNLQKPKPQPFVPGERRLEVCERLYADGTVHVPLDDEGLQRAVASLQAMDVDAVAICFLFSFANAEHERKAKSTVQALMPNTYVTASHEIVPEFREYPRLSTTVLNAYLGPVMQKYLEHFESTVQDLGISHSPYVTQSNGGILSIEECVRAPIRTAVSGPSAGVVAAMQIGEQTNVSNLITLDLGGTSADISLVRDGEPLLSVDREIDEFPAHIPMLDITTIGAGGGSIAWTDPGGALKVGPHSAGAVPGPACYGRGGEQPTVTDANAVLGRIDPKTLLGGRMSLEIGAAKNAIEVGVCKATGLSLLDAASGIISVVNANMVRAIRRVTVERGYDPRDFAMVAFGGAGPLHAVAVARELDVETVIVPASPGTLCSLGLLVTDVKVDYVRSHAVEPNTESLQQISTFFHDMTSEANAALAREAIPEAQRNLKKQIEARYKHQNYEIPIPVQSEELNETTLPEITERFHAAHERLYGYASPNAPIEFVNYRLTAVGTLPKAPLPYLEQREGQSLQPIDTRNVYFDGAFTECPVYQRDNLRAGDVMGGPAIVEQVDSTILIPPEVRWHVDNRSNIIVEIRKDTPR